MTIATRPSDKIIIDPKTGRLSLEWDAWFQKVANFPLVYVTAGLPGSASPGSIAYASDARKPGQGAGHGTGMLVFFDGSGWFTTAGTAVTS